MRKPSKALGQARQPDAPPSDFHVEPVVVGWSLPTAEFEKAGIGAVTK
jgi:hypothetical protein